MPPKKRATRTPGPVSKASRELNSLKKALSAIGISVSPIDGPRALRSTRRAHTAPPEPPVAVAPVAEGGAHDVVDQDAAQAAGLIPANLVATAVQVEAEQDAGNQVVADPMIADLAAAQVAVDQGVGNQIGVVPVVNDLVVIDSEYVEPEIEVLNPVGRQEDSDGEAGENELFRTA